MNTINEKLKLDESDDEHDEPVDEYKYIYNGFH